MRKNFGMYIIFFFCLFFLIACSQSNIELTEKGSKIQLLPTPEEYPQCLFLGDLKAVSLTGPISSYQKAWSKIRNSVAYQGGTHIKIILSETNKLSSTIQGEAYKCPVNLAGNIIDNQNNVELTRIPEETE